MKPFFHYYLCMIGRRWDLSQWPSPIYGLWLALWVYDPGFVAAIIDFQCRWPRRYWHTYPDGTVELKRSWPIACLSVHVLPHRRVANMS